MVTTSLSTLSNGISNFTAQNLGAEKYDRIGTGFRAGLRIVWVISIPLTIVYFAAGRYLVYAFLDGPTGQAIHVGTRFLQIVSPFYFAVAAKLAADGILRGMGLMKQFVISTFADLALRVLFASILSATALQTAGIWMSWPIGWVISAAVSIVFYIHAMKRFQLNRGLSKR